MSRSQLALARQYRPQNFQSVVGQEATLRALMSALDHQRLHHAYLFTGTRGVGKTTLARIFAKALNCEQGISAKPCDACKTCQAINMGSYVDLIEVDAASRTKVEDTRELLENVQYLPTQGRFKIYLIDEVHMLSGHSFNALLKTLEEPPSHVKFLLATTDPQKLPATILSRCLQFHLQRLSYEQIANHLAYVLGQEQVNFEKEALEELARAADGSMRDALSLLDQALAYGHGRIIEAEVRTLLGLTEKGRIIELWTALQAKDAKKILELVKTIANTAPNFSSVLIELLTFIHQIAIAQQVPEALDDSSINPKIILAFAEQISAEELQLYYQIAMLGQRDLPYAPTPQMGFEMILLRMLAFQPVSVASASFSASAGGASAGVSDISAASASSTTQNSTSAVVASVASTASSAPAIPAASVSTAPIAALATSELTELSEWSRLIPSLNLSGMAKELACHCTVNHWTETELHLSLHASQKPLLNKRNEEHLQKVISQYFKKPITIKINIESQSNIKSQNTPAMQYQKVEDKANEQARHLIETDPNVEQLMQRFGATIEQVSVPSTTVPGAKTRISATMTETIHASSEHEEDKIDLPWEEN